MVGSAIVLWLAYPFLDGETNRAFDDLFHKATQSYVADAFSEGRSPFGVLPTMFGIPGLRIYQCFHQLIAGFVQYSTGLSPSVVHVWLVTLFFAATPWSYRHLLVRLGFNPVVAGAAGLLCIGSISGFGNSFEAYFELGIVTQALGSVLLPLTLAKIVQICKEGSGTIAAGVFFAMTAMTHAMYAIYCILIAVLVVLYYAQKPTALLKLSIAAALALALAAGWLIPFLQLRYEHKSVTDIVARPDRIVWSAGHSGASLGRALITGRTLDGGRKDKSVDEKLDNKLNMTFTREVRFPYYTIMAMLGVVFALIDFKRRKSKLMFTGLVLGLLLILGFDDFKFMYKLPIFNQIQTFRIGYFIEFFAIGLAAYGASQVLALVGRGLRIFSPTFVSKIVMILVVITAVCAYYLDLERIVTPMLDSWDEIHFSRVDKTIRKTGKPDPQKRVLVKFPSPPSRQFRFSLEHALEVLHGHRSACNHWTSLSPTINLAICGAIFHPERAQNLVRMMGIRFLVTTKKQLPTFIPSNSEKSTPYRLLGRSGRLVRIIEDKEASMLHEPPGPRILVIADPTQWYWLTKGWVARFGKRIGDENVPWLLRGNSEALSDQRVINHVDGVIYADKRSVEHDTEALVRIASSGKTILSGFPIEGVDTRVTRPGDGPWYNLLPIGSRESVKITMTQLDQGIDPEYAKFRVNGQEDTSVFFSMQAFHGWRAVVDGETVATFAGGPDLVAAIIPAGEHEIEFIYESTTLENVCMFISLLAWLWVVFWNLAKYGMRTFDAMRSVTVRTTPHG